MAELPNRARLEVELYRTINRFFKPYLQRDHAMRAPTWNRLEENISNAIRPMLQKVRQEAAAALYAEHGEGEKPPANLFSGLPDRASELAADLVDVTKRRWANLPNKNKTTVIAWRRQNFGRRRAKLIAVSELTIAQTEGEIAAANRLDLTATWKTERKPCKKCAAMSGKPSKYWKLFYPKGPPSPHIGCVLGKTPVVIPDAISVVVADYDGPIVRINCSGSEPFEVTPNHMLLTDLGWMQASELVNGMNVVRAVNRQWEVSSVPDNDWKPVLAQQVFDSLTIPCSMDARFVPAAAEHLHGDAAFAKGNINVVDVSSLLRTGSNSQAIEPSNHLSLGLIELADFLDSDCSAFSLNSRSDSAAHGGIRSARESLAILNREVLHADSSGLGATAFIEAKFGKHACDHWSRHREIASHLQNTLSGKVSLAEVIKVDVLTGDGSVPIYDFETLSSLYIINNGIVSSNCRCSLIWRKRKIVKQRWPTTMKGYIQQA